MSEAVQPFRIDTSDADLRDLQQRLRATRWPEAETVDDWSQGIPLAYLKEVCEYWGEKYDWRERERRLNEAPQFRTEIDAVRTVHAAGCAGPGLDGKPGAGGVLLGSPRKRGSRTPGRDDRQPRAGHSPVVPGPEKRPGGPAAPANNS